MGVRLGWLRHRRAVEEKCSVRLRRSVGGRASGRAVVVRSKRMGGGGGGGGGALLNGALER